jgi:hypothetical protein
VSIAPDADAFAIVPTNDGDFEAAMSAHFESQAPTDEVPPDDVVEGDPDSPGGDAEGEEAPPSTPSTEGEPPPPSEQAPPPEPEGILLGDVLVPPEQAANLGQFWSWSQGEGQPWIEFLGGLLQAGLSPAQVSEFLRPSGEATAGPAAEQAPPEDDYSDPEVKALRAELATRDQRMGQLEERLNAQALANSQALLVKATNDFVTKRGLTADEMTKVRTFVESRNLVAGFARDEEGKPRDALTALGDSFETAYWSIPEFREREMARQQEELKTQQKKDRKLAAVGGNSGSVPARTKTVTPEESKNAMVAELAEHMGFPSRTG